MHSEYYDKQKQNKLCKLIIFNQKKRLRSDIFLFPLIRYDEKENDVLNNYYHIGKEQKP
jgi:hypothetical protein